MATLVVSLILLIAITIMTFSVAKVSGLEQRISANDVRTLTAHEAAQASIEQGIAYLNANLSEIDSAIAATTTSPAGWRNSASSARWKFCTTSDITLPCGNGQSNQYNNAWLRYGVPNQIGLPGSPYTTTVHYLTQHDVGADPNVRAAPRVIILASVIPNSDPLAGSAVIQQIVQYSSLIKTPSSPLATSGTVTMKGNITVYGNPSPAASFYPPLGVLGAGKPLSVWSGGAVGVQGSALTCLPGSNCTGSNKLTTAQNYPPGGGDITANDLNFPADLFKYIFGVPNTEANTIRDKSTVLANCSSLTEASSGLFWVTGDCDLTSVSGGIIGSLNAPTVMVVNGSFKMAAGNTFFGLIYSRSGSVNLSGGFILHGGLASANNIDTGTGGPIFYYQDISTFPTNNTGGFVKVPGGWLDAYQRPVS